ncbi:MAG: hypothetical protein AAFN74_15480, partial [Myxococcota bacterium]
MGPVVKTRLDYLQWGTAHKDDPHLSRRDRSVEPDIEKRVRNIKIRRRATPGRTFFPRGPPPIFEGVRG